MMSVQTLYKEQGSEGGNTDDDVNDDGTNDWEPTIVYV